ncbi:unnamed protein product [Gordionus sp. m RMFG-2023]
MGKNIKTRREKGSMKPISEKLMLEPNDRCCSIRNESIHGIRDLNLEGSETPDDTTTYNLRATFKGPLSTLPNQPVVSYFYRLFEYASDGVNHGDRIENKNNQTSLKYVNQTNFEFLIYELEKRVKYFIKVFVSYNRRFGSKGQFAAMQTFKYTFAPRIINTVGKLRMEAEYKGQYDIMVNWSIDHMKNRVFFENIEYYHVELLPTDPNMTAHEQSQLLEKFDTGFTFPKVTPHEYRITVALSFKDEHRNMSFKDHVTARVFITVP